MQLKSFNCHPMVGVCRFVGHPFGPFNHAFNQYFDWKDIWKQK
jgi:hypothetical protein